jgi:hypothetical protein
MYGHFGGKDKKVVRKEDVKGDVLLFISDENGRKEIFSNLNSVLNLPDEFNKELFEKYFKSKKLFKQIKIPCSNEYQ